MQTTIKTSLFVSSQQLAEAHLIVVPAVGEILQIDDTFYTVISRQFKLKTDYNGGKPCGYVQSCILGLKLF